MGKKSNGRSSNDYRKLQQIIKDLKVLKAELLPGERGREEQRAAAADNRTGRATVARARPRAVAVPWKRRAAAQQQHSLSCTSVEQTNGGGWSGRSARAVSPPNCDAHAPCSAASLRHSLCVQMRRIRLRRRRWQRSMISSARSTNSTRCSSTCERSAGEAMRLGGLGRAHTCSSLLLPSWRSDRRAREKVWWGVGLGRHISVCSHSPHCLLLLL